MKGRSTPRTILLFDIDGTLIRAGGAGRKALNLAAFRLFGRKDACSEISLQGRTDLWNFAEAVRVSTGRRAKKTEVNRLMKEYLKHLPRFIRTAVRNKTYILPPGVKTLVRRLHKEKDVVLALGTGNLERGARIKLEPSGFNEYFRFGGFGSDSIDRPTLLKKAVSRVRGRKVVPSSRVYVIGDTPLDVKAGRKAGYKTIAVGTGFSTWAALKASRPDHLSKDFKKTKKWLKWFGIKP